MREGAFVLLDCLGFRGIWNRVNPEKLITKLKSMEKEAATKVFSRYSSSELSFGSIRLQLSLLSDTVALSVQYQPQAYANGAEPGEGQKNLLVSFACDSASALASLFIDSEIPLPLRGCISFGHHLCDGNFLIGPAVDQAAEYMDEPEGAFIWVLPGAVERYKNHRERALELIKVPKEILLDAHAIAAGRGVSEAEEIVAHPESTSDIFIEALRTTYAQILSAPTVIEPYPMPIKRGNTIDAGVINPFMSAQNDEERKRIFVRYEQFLQGNTIEIWIKRENTLKFLNIAQEKARKFRENTS